MISIKTFAISHGYPLPASRSRIHSSSRACIAQATANVAGDTFPILGPDVGSID
jgi:hypothetical protein